MRRLSYWKKFVKSGNVFDYLEYKAVEKYQKGMIKQNIKKIEM